MENYENRMAVIVSKYATPLAALLIGMGIGVALPPGKSRSAAAALWVFGLVFNVVVTHLIRNEGAGKSLVMTRLFVNVFLNTVIVYLMLLYWPAIWMLLALTPIAMAIYSTRGNTMVVAGVVSAVLLSIRYMRDPGSAGAWSGELAHCVFIFLISLLINELSVLARAGLARAEGKA